MTTLSGERLFDYLSRLEEKVHQLGGDSTSPHHFLKQVLNLEKQYLKDYHAQYGNVPVLSFSGNGLPSTDSLNPDLEAICKLNNENLILKSFRRELSEINHDLYQTCDEKEYESKRQSTKNPLIASTIFSLGESEDRDLELKVQENLFIDSLDEYSRNNPLLIKEIKTNYKIVFGELMFQTDQKFFSFKDNPIEIYNKNLPEQNKKISLEAISNIGLAVSDLFKGFVDRSFRFPTFCRKGSSDEASEFYKLGEDELAFGVGFTGIANIIFYWILFVGDSDLAVKALSLQLATNAVSGVYEWYRYETKKTQEKYIKKIKSRDSEN